MNTRLTRACSVAVLCIAGAFGATTALASDAAFSKIPSKGVTFKKKAGYWTECRYSGLGTVCETVYAKAKNGKFRLVPVASAKLVRKQGETMVCYWGSNNAEICYWAYSPRKAK